MRVLIDPRGGAASTAGAVPDAPEDLEALYAVPELPWLRVNMVATVDGAATGRDGLSGSINNDVDEQVFGMLRRLADAVVVGAGTARIEGYRPSGRPVVVVSRSGRVPETLLEQPAGDLVMATCGAAPGLERAREMLGDDNVILLGSHSVDLTVLRERLAADRGWRHLLCEGGPHLLRDLLAARAVDELCVTVVPRLVGGLGPRITDGPFAEASLTLLGLLEQDGTLLARWLVDDA